MKAKQTILSLLLVASILVPPALIGSQAHAEPNRTRPLSDVWATETMDGEDYTIHIIMADPDDQVPTGPLGPERADRIRSIWVAGPTKGALQLRGVLFALVTPASGLLEAEALLDTDACHRQHPLATQLHTPSSDIRC